MASTPPAAAPAPSGAPPADSAPNFEDAFAAAAAAEGPDESTTPPAETPPADTPPAETPPAETPPAETPPADTPAEPAAGTPPADGTQAAPAAPTETPPAPAAPAAGPTAEQIVAQLAEKLSQPAPAAPAAEAPAEVTPIYSEDEQKVLLDYEKNWPDVAQAEALKRKGEYHDLLKYTFTEVHSFLQPYLAQIAAMGNTLHEGELKGLVSDYTPALEEDVTKWIDTQPAYLQAPYKQVMQSGTSEEVADLIGRYRGATGTTPPAAPASAGGQAPAVPAPPAKTELSSLAKQAAESLAPVSSDRSQAPAGEDPQDFESAFARYSSEAATSP